MGLVVRTLAVVMLLLPARGLAATPSFAEAVKELAAKVAKDLRRMRGEVVRVTVDGPQHHAEAKGMTERFVAALPEAFRVSSILPDFHLELRYRRTGEPGHYSFSATWRDEEGRVLGRHATTFRFVDPTLRAAIEGATVDNTLDEEGRAAPATKALVDRNLDARPRAFVAADADGVGTIVRPRRKSRFGIELLTKPASAPPGLAGYTPHPVNLAGGYPVCELDDTVVYAVRVHNDANHAVAVDLRIDGINMWRESRVAEWRRRGKFVVPARASVVIRGWHTGDESNPQQHQPFRVVEFPDPFIERLGRDESSLGQISAQFFASWKIDADRPAVEPLEPPRSPRSVMIGPSLLAAVTVRYARPERDLLP